jgi:chromosome segregation ATPase
MAENAPTVEATEARAEAAVIDAEAGAADQARQAADATVANAAIVAAAAEDAAAQRVEQIADQTNGALEAQEGSIEWLRAQNAEMVSRLTETTTRLERAETLLGEMGQRVETSLSEIMSKLTPPVSQDPPAEVMEPGEAKPEPNAGADGQKAPEARRPKYRVL